MLSFCVDLYILRHGKAEAGDLGLEDAERKLTGKGKEEIALIAQWMASRGIKFDLIATSPLKRARETAGIIAASRGLKNRYNGLGITCAWRKFRRFLARHRCL